MAGTVLTPGQVVTVIAGVWRGRIGKVAGEPDGTNSVRVLLSRLSEYEAERVPVFTWIPVEFLEVRG